MTEELFVKQADSYAKGRPKYPASLFEKLASLTKHHERAWDVGTGNGQSAVMVAEHYKSVVATDVSESQLALAMPKANVTYSKMSATPSLEELERVVGAEGSVDLVTVAAALHWFDLDKFYPIVKRVLRKPGGVFAAWTYTIPRISPEVDELARQFHESSRNFMVQQRQWALEEYRTIPFPFKPLRGQAEAAGLGSVEVDVSEEIDIPMTMDGLLTLWKSSSPVQRALDEGFDLVNGNAKEALMKAWGSPDRVINAKFPIFMLIGTVSEEE